MKKIRYILFVFIIAMLFPFGVMADENKVYWEIGGEDKNLETVLENKEISENLLYSVDSIIFNNYEKSNNKITDFDTEIDISKSQDNSVIAGIKDSKLYIQYSGTLYFNSNSSYVFFNMEQITSITGLEYVNTSSVTDMSYMFSGMNNIEILNINSFDTSNVENMSYMFNDVLRLKKLDLYNFNTSNVTDMSYMFNNCIGMFDLNISSFDTSNVVNMSHMFSEMEYVDLLDISGFDTSNVTNMSYMFKNNRRLRTLDLSSFNTANVTDMSSMFAGLRELTKLDVNHFDTSNVTDMSSMFSFMGKIVTINVSHFNTSKATDMSGMFSEMGDLISLDLSNFDTTNVIDMAGMFSNDGELKVLNISNFNTLKVADMSRMFAGLINIKRLDVSHFNTANVTDMSSMFSGVGSNVQDFELNVSNFDTSNVTNMQSMFASMNTILTLDLSNFNTSKVIDMKKMFYAMNSLNKIDISNFNTSKVTNMTYMFDFCENLRILDLSSFEISYSTNVVYMLGHTKLNKIVTPEHNASIYIELPVNMYDENNNKYTKINNTLSGVVLRTKNIISFDIVDDSKEILYGESYGVLPIIEKDDYIFLGWYKTEEFQQLVTSETIFDDGEDIILYAKLVKSKNKVTFVDEDGTVLKDAVEYDYGTKASDIVKPVDPTKNATAQYTYIFSGWTPMIEDVTKDIVYTATYSSVLNIYTVTWLNEDGTILETDKNVAYGTLPKYDGEIPNKKGNVQYKYVFDKWDKEISEVIGDVTYTAIYSSVLNTYTVTWLNEDGTVLDTDKNVAYGTMPKYDGETPKKDGTSQYTYVFDKWDKEVSEVTGNVTYKATFKEIVNKYRVTFVDEDGTTILKEQAEYDYSTKASDIVKPEDPIKKATAEYTYIFSGWTPMIEDVTKDIVYKATYSSVLNTYTVTWLNEDGTLLEIDKNVEYGTMPKYGSETPKKDRTPQYTYVFDKWDKEISEVTGDVTYKAVFKKELNKYKVTFVDEDGTTILKETREYDYGTISNDIVKPSNPSKKATAQYTYTFSGWTPTIENVTKDIVYKATYSSQVNRYKVHFVYQNDVGASIMETFEYDYGTKVSDIVKPDPTRKSNTEYTFTFTGWSPEIEDVTKDITYTATYSSMLNTYTVTWLNEDGTVLETDVVEYGIMPQYDGDIPEKAGVGKYVYVFDKWDKEVSRVTGDVTYTAVFKELNVSITSDVYDIGDNYVYVGKKYFTMSNISLVSEELDITGYKETGLVYIYYKGKLVKTYDLISISSSYYEWGSEYIYLKTEDININSINIVNGDISVENNKLLVKHNDIVLDEFDLIQISSEIHNINVSLKYSNYMYLGINNLNLNDISIVNGNLIVEDNKLLVKYKDKIVDEYVLIKISSDKYDLSKKYILSTNELFDINKVNVINGYLELDDDVLKVYYDDVINGTTYKMSLSEYDIVNITSEMQDVTKPYLYFNRNYGSEQSVLKITNAKQYVSDDKLNIFYENELLFSYDIVSLSSTKYKIGRDYIYTKNINLDLNDITIRGVNVTLKKEENKLKVYYGEEIIKMFDMITLSSDLYNIYFDDDILGYMYIGNKKLDLSKINAISGKLKEQNNMLYVFYDDEQIDGLKIVSVSSDKYTILDEEYTDYIYVGEDYIDTDKILSGIKVINGTAKFNRNSNGLIHIVPDGFNSLSLGSLSIITAITDISLNVTQVNLSKNNLYQVIATINPWNTLDDKTLTWTSENESVAKVYSLSGDNSIVNVSAIGSGETIITVTTKNGKSASFKVIVSGFDIEVESNNIYVSYDGKEHQIIPNVKTSGAKISYSLDGIDYNLTESPKFIKPGRYKVYYKVEAQNYNDYYGDGEVRISGILSMPSNMIIKNKYLIINNYDNSLYRLMSGINLYAFSDFFQYRYDGGLYQPETDYSGSNQFLVSTGKSFLVYIDSVLSPMYSYTMVLRGDLSGDGEIDSLDLATMMNHISGKKELMGAHLEAAYLNNDEDIDSLDLAYLMNHIAGKEGY